MVTIPHDKLLHYVAGTLIYSICSLFIGMYAIGIVIVIAVGKEAYDYYTKKGTPEYMDAAATVLGGLVELLSNL